MRANFATSTICSLLSLSLTFCCSRPAESDEPEQSSAAQTSQPLAGKTGNAGQTGTSKNNTQAAAGDSVATPGSPKPSSPTNDLLEQAFHHFRQERPDRAIACLTPLLVHATAKDLHKKENAQVAARYFTLIGRAMLYDDNLPAAVQCFQIADQLDPDNVLIVVNLADALARVGRYSEAEPLYKRLDAECEHSETACRFVALNHLRSGELNKAKAVLLIAKKLKGTEDSWKWHAIMGRTLGRQGDITSGVKETLAAAKLCEDPYQAKLLESTAAVWQFNEKEREARLREAAIIAPDDCFWKVSLASLLLGGGKKNPYAMKLYTEVAKGPRFQIKVYTQYGGYLAGTKKERAARKCVEHLALLAPWSENYLRFQASLYSAKHNTAEAQKTYETLLHLHPHSSNSYILYSDFLAANNMPDKAFSILNQFAQTLPDCSEAWQRLGDAYVNRGDWDKGKPCFEKALSLLPVNEHLDNPLTCDEFSKCHAGLAAYYYRDKQLAKALPEALLFNQLKFTPDLPAYLRLVNLRPPHISVKGMTTKDREFSDHILLADALYQMHNLSGAINEYQKAAALNPDDINLHCYLYTLYSESGNLLAAAQEDLQISNKLLGKIPHDLGKNFADKKKTEAAKSGAAPSDQQQQ